MKELKETVQMMTSVDYKERFIAEYQQTKIRYEKLRNLCVLIEASQMRINGLRIVDEPDHDCPYELLREQQSIMGNYLHVLELRAAFEKIDLPK